VSIAQQERPAGRTAPSAVNDQFAERLRDDALMRRMANGDREAFAAAYDMHARAALSLAVRLTRNRESAEEAVQDTFVGLWLKADRYRHERGSLRSFVLGMARHRALDILRRDAVLSRRRASDELLEQVLDGSDWPEVVVIRRSDAEGIRAAIDCLSATQAEALRLAYFQGLSHSEIASRLHIPLGTVKSRIRIGLANLRDEFGPPVREDRQLEGVRPG
jgi:RNA polymerase sigma-70 factor, ECF subfamily